LRAALADGTLVKGGGRVVKNDAGYGLHRLLTGSRGTLGVIVETSFKVLPRPESRGSVVFSFRSEARACNGARRVLDSGLEPVFANVLIGENASGREDEQCRLAIGFEGTAARVAAHLQAVGERVAPAEPEGRLMLDVVEDAVLRRALDDWTDPGATLPAVLGLGANAYVNRGPRAVLPDERTRTLSASPERAKLAGPSSAAARAD